MKTIYILLATLLLAAPANAVTVTCISEGGNVVRIDYNASDETVPPIAFALNITVNNGATITRVYDYKVGDSNTASPGYGIFPNSMQFDQSGKITNWGSPVSNAGLGTSAVSLGMAARYADRINAPRANGTLCRILVAPGAAQTVNVAVAQDTNAGGIVLEDAAVTTKFTGIGCTLNGSNPPPPAPPAAPLTISYPAASNTGQYNVNWSTSTGATSYQLERSNNAGSTWTQVYSGTALSNSQTVTNGSYRYRVRATNGAGSSGWTTGTTDCVVSIPAPSTPPPAPAAITYPTSSTGHYTVSWSASIGATSYRLDRSRNGGEWTRIYSGSALSRSETVSRGSYRYRVRASNNAGHSSWRTGTWSCRVSTEGEHDADEHDEYEHDD